MLPVPTTAKASISCAFKCFNFVAAMFPAAIRCHMLLMGLRNLLSDGTLDGYVIPPTHPPPI